MICEQFTPCHCYFTEMAHDVTFFTMELNVGIHADFIMFECNITLFAGLEFAFNLFMFLKLGQWDNFKTVWIVLAPDFRLLERLSKLWVAH